MDKIKDNEEFIIMVVFEKLFNFIFFLVFFCNFQNRRCLFDRSHSAGHNNNYYRSRFH